LTGFQNFLEGTKENHEKNRSQVNEFPDSNLQPRGQELEEVLILDNDVRLIINNNSIFHQWYLVSSPQLTEGKCILFTVYLMTLTEAQNI
jgi:hypothetical protein